MRRLATLSRLVAIVWALAFVYRPGDAQAQRWWERPVAPPQNPPVPAQPPAITPPTPGTVTPVAPPVPTAAMGNGTRDWRWVQILSSPRIGGRLTAVAADPQNPARIFVGTQEGTIVRSVDSGVTWRELELSPFVRERRRTREREIDVRPLTNTVDVNIPPSFSLGALNSADRVFSFGFERTNATDHTQAFFPQLLQFHRTTPADFESLLDDATDEQLSEPVLRIALCPGATFPVLVATGRELLGSFDDGLTYVRLMRLPGRLRMRDVQCNPVRPNEILLETDFGLFYSLDGGSSFEQELRSRPGRGSNTGAFDPNTPGRIFMSSGAFLYNGNLLDDDAFRFVYPDFNNAETAPWETINWIEPDGNAVWIATDDGLRRSRDGGQNWAVEGRSMFDRHRIRQVVVGTNTSGAPRIAVLARECPGSECRRAFVQASDDDGRTWFPFFDGLTRRSINEIISVPQTAAGPPRWFVVTAGELWTTHPASPGSGAVDASSQVWARRRLSNTPPMDAVIQDLLRANRLTERQIDDLSESANAAALLPEINARFLLFTDQFERNEVQDRTSPRINDETNTFTYWSINATATWPLPNLAWAGSNDVDAANNREPLYELRRQLSFIGEDVWHERMTHLQRLARGMSDVFQIVTLRERVLSLEAILEVWSDEPFPGTTD